MFQQRMVRVASVAMLSLSSFALAADWEVDPTYSAVLEGGSALVDVLPATNGKVYLRTNYAIDGTLTNGAVRRVNADGSLDDSFQPPQSSWEPFAVYPDGRVLLRQNAIYGDPSTWKIRRFSANGALDLSFAEVTQIDTYSSGYSPTVVHALCLTDGGVILYGSLWKVNDVSVPGIALLNADGSLSARFQQPTLGGYSGVLSLADGKTLVSGPTSINNTAVNAVGRLNADGTIDATFQCPSGLKPGALSAGPNGTILVVPPYDPPFRLLANGPVDAAYTSHTVGTPAVYGAGAPDGSLPYLTSNGSNYEMRRLRPDGSDNGNAITLTVHVDYNSLPHVTTTEDGSAYVDSPLTTEREQLSRSVTRLTSSGAIDKSFDLHAGGPATFLNYSFLSDGSLVVDGFFSWVNNVSLPGHRLIRLNPDGSLNANWMPPVQTTYGVSGYVQQPNGKILQWGSKVAGQLAVRFNDDGSVDKTFQMPCTPGYGTMWRCFAVDSSGTIYVATYQAETKISRYTPDGVLDPTFVSGTTRVLAQVLATPDGGVVALEDTVSATQYSDRTLAYVKLKHDGSLDPTFNVPFSSIASARSGTGVLPDSSVIATGMQGDYGIIAHINAAGAIDSVANYPTTSGTSVVQQGLATGSALYSFLQSIGHGTTSGPGGTAGASDGFSVWVSTEGRMRLTSDSSSGILQGYWRAGVPHITAPSVTAGEFQSPAKAGTSETFTVTLAGGPPSSIQWQKDGAAIPGATTATYTIAKVTPVDAGKYSCVVTNAIGTATWEGTLVVTSTAHLVNLSTRVPAGAAAGTPICGFVVDGTQTLPVLLRGIGPTLGTFGVSGTMPQPTIKLHNPDASVTTFSGWPTSRGGDMTAIGAFGLATGSKDAATFLSLGGGKYTAEISDANGGSGVVMLETYDASGDAGSGSKLINASTLGFVGTDDKAMFTGFVVKGAGTVKVLIRAVGPSLSAFSIANPIADPKIQVFQGQTKLAENDNWGTRTDGVSVATIQAAANSVNAFTIGPASKDAVILKDFAEGTYSAQITGANGETGTAIVELYVVP